MLRNLSYHYKTPLSFVLVIAVTRLFTWSSGLNTHSLTRPFSPGTRTSSTRS